MTTTDQPPVRPRPSAAAVYVVVAVAAALGAIAFSAATQRVTSADLRDVAVLMVLAVGYDWLARRVESVRRRTTSGPYVTMDSVWVLAAAVNLPTVLVAVLLLATQGHGELQARRTGSGKGALRVGFNVAASLLPAAVVSQLVVRPNLPDQSLGAVGGSSTLVALVVAVAAYGVLNTLMVGAVIALTSGERRLLPLLGSGTENLVELATLTLGALVGLAITVDVWLALLALPVLVLLQRIALVDHLESAASEDGKTGLLNSAAWNHLAERDLERARVRGSRAAVMVVDLDHFKRVNDTYGHLVGDSVLRTVAGCMRTMLRERDHVARFGGEEFVAFLPGADLDEAERVAERLRLRIADTAVVLPTGLGSGSGTGTGEDGRPVAGLGPPDGGDQAAGAGRLVVTVSIGIAAHPHHGVELDDLLARADAALYAAKHAGRNQTRTAA